jgi:hypothetical protein
MSLKAKYRLGLPLGMLLATAALAPLAAAQGGSPISLFAPGSARTEPPPGEGVRGMRPETTGAIAYFTVSPQASRSLRSPKAGPTQMRIELPGGKDVTCSLHSDKASAGGVTFSGSVADEDLSSCDLFVSDGKVTGAIDTDAGRYRIMPVGKGGTHAVVEVKTQAFPQEEDRVLEPPLPPAPDKRSMRDEPPCDVAGPGGKAKQFGPLRVLFLYTPNAASDSTDIKGEIAVMMRQFNQTLSLNKNFKATAELAAALQVTYTESGDMETDLDRLSGKVPGFFDNVRQIRDKYKADFVHMLIRGSGDACGIGWLLDPQRPGSGDWSFSLADRECAVGNFSFIHEVGHNLGLNHDRAVVSNAGAEEFNFGYVDIAHGIRTVMAYNNACSDVNKNCRRLPVYSTPYLFYKGVVLGKPITDSEGADNAEILCRNAAAATKFAETRAAGQ